MKGDREKCKSPVCMQQPPAPSLLAAALPAVLPATARQNASLHLLLWQNDTASPGTPCNSHRTTVTADAALRPAAACSCCVPVLRNQRQPPALGAARYVGGRCGGKQGERHAASSLGAGHNFCVL